LLTALIVDDEPPARAELRYHLEQHADVQVVGEAANAREAERLLTALSYDVVFLDIQMPGLSGLDLAARLKSLKEAGQPVPHVVFVTAHDRYAVAAFDVPAVDYLLKPVDKDRLSATLDRLRGRNAVAPAVPPTPPPFLAGIDGERTIPIPLDAVALLRAEGDTVIVETTDGRRFPVRGTLTGLERTLPADRFFRCHRSYIVNLYQVLEIVPFFNGTWLLKVRGGSEDVPVSRSQARRLRQLMGIGQDVR
jgi:DNA-binding LytR/AlgR family response regulator